jgi:3-hydroxyacyl-CoA dehydrogenase
VRPRTRLHSAPHTGPRHERGRAHRRGRHRHGRGGGPCLLEFIDWGGGDILYYASRYLSSELGERYRAPEIVERNMHEKRNGLRDGNGFYDWRNTDVAAYREKRLGDFSRMLTHAGLLPQPGAARALD